MSLSIPRSLIPVLIFFAVGLFARPLEAQPSPLRIITLSPNLTEIVFALGAGKNIVGVISHSDYPPAARHLPLVGDYQHINIEKILTLHPTLILSWSMNHSGSELGALKKFGIPVHHFFAQHLTDLPKLTQKVADAIDRSQTGKRLAHRQMMQLKQLRTHYQVKKHIRVFYQIWHQPLMTISRKSWLNDAVSLCGGANIFAQASVAYPQVNLEQVLALHPQVIVLTTTQHDEQAIWKKWQSSQYPHQVISLNPDWISRFGPRLILGVKQLCTKLQRTRT